MRIGFEEFLYKGNDEVSKDWCQKNFKTLVLNGYKLSYNYPN